ncbi:two-component system, OmpR family, phosphate regulon sensor histidine kinase PhoR [Burkholderiales bacterium]|nr:MAG: PAS domain-containing sensor histidine kinase [Burkholderiales bacterium]CAG0994442.1 two-component system, OmpR family, phosphate regulon sensor histidine kinase PhoR [Burkholderiales bacterium]
MMSEAQPIHLQATDASPRASETERHCFEALAASTHDMVAILDTSGQRLYVNPAFRALFGDAAASPGANSFAQVHPEDRVRVSRLFRSVAQDGRGQRAEYRVHDRFGAVRYLESQSNVIECHCGSARRVVVVSRDTTARRQMEDELRRLRDDLERRIVERTAELSETNLRLERTVCELRVAHRELREREEDSRRTLARERELNEMKLRFVSMASHEFRTPLAMILSASDLLRDYDARLPPEERREMLDDIHGAVWRLTEMLDEVLTLSRADAGRLDFKPQPMPVLEFCRALLAERSRACGGSHRFTLDAAPAEEIRLIDEKLLRLSLDNLLANAARYSPTGSEVRLAVNFTDQETVFEVIDQGIGIPDADQPRIFETFFRAGNVGCTPGTGLGLAIVDRALRRHQGQIRCISALGQGTRMEIRLPRGGEAQHAATEGGGAGSNRHV